MNSYTHWGISGQQVGGVFILDVGMLVLGIILMFLMQAFRPAFFRGETLNRDSATLVTEDFLAKKARPRQRPDDSPERCGPTRRRPAPGPVQPNGLCGRRAPGSERGARTGWTPSPSAGP